VKVITPRYEACGQKRIPGRYFVGGHYVSDKWQDNEELKRDENVEVQGGFRRTRDSHRDSVKYANEISAFYEKDMVINYPKTSIKDKPKQ